MKIVCLGDSFTSGYGVAGEAAWPHVLAQLTGHEIINRGVHGDTTGGMLARFYHDVVPERPRMVVMEGGFNDLLAGAPRGSIQANWMSLVHQAYHNQIIPVILLQPYGDAEAFRRHWPPFVDIDAVQQELRAVQEWMIPFCRGFSVFHVDVSQGVKRYIDGIHMDADGHRYVAETIKEFFHQIEI